MAGVGEKDDVLLDNGDDSQVYNSRLPDDLLSAPFPFVTSASSGPAPVIYSVQQSKVRVYKPEITTTTKSTSTARPSTTTSAQATPGGTPVRPYEYQLAASSTELPRRPPARPQQRPLVYNKRRPGPGEERLSKPFEYLSRLSQFLGERVFTGRQETRDTRRRRPPLVRHRTQDAAGS